MPKRLTLALAGCMILAGCKPEALHPVPPSMLSDAKTPSYERIRLQQQAAAVAPIHASSTHPHFPLEHLNDGNRSSAWAPAPDDAQPSLSFPFPRPMTLTGMALKMSPAGVTVDVQTLTAEGWETVLQGLSPEVATMDVFSLPYLETQELRLIFRGENISQLLVCEVEFFDDGQPLPTPTPSTPPGPDEDCGCFVTGGGWIASGQQKATFGFVALRNSGRGVSGNLQLHDQATKAQFHGRVTAVSCDANSATFSGTLDGGGTFSATVIDNGEPGRDDRFSFSTSTGVELSGPLGGGRPGGGNIQFHQGCD